MRQKAKIKSHAYIQLGEKVLQTVHQIFEPDIPVILHLLALTNTTIHIDTVPPLYVLQDGINCMPTTDYFFTSIKPEPIVVTCHRAHHSKLTARQAATQDPASQQTHPLQPGETRVYPSMLVDKQVPVLSLTESSITSQVDLQDAFQKHEIDDPDMVAYTLDDSEEEPFNTAIDDTSEDPTIVMGKPVTTAFISDDVHVPTEKVGCLQVTSQLQEFLNHFPPESKEKALEQIYQILQMLDTYLINNPQQHRYCMSPDSKYILLIMYATKLEINLCNFLAIWAVLSILLDTQSNELQYVKTLQQVVDDYYNRHPIEVMSKCPMTMTMNKCPMNMIMIMTMIKCPMTMTMNIAL